jgi:HxlR-like helix-turn-helix
MSPTRQTIYASPVQLTLDVVGGKWKPLILWLLRDGRPPRFNALQRAIPEVAHKVLTHQAAHQKFPFVVTWMITPAGRRGQHAAQESSLSHR